MPLIHTPQGVAVLRDWGPERIGRAYREPQAYPGEGAEAVQAALLRRPPRTSAFVRPVPVLDTLEKLVDFLRA